MTMRQTHGGGGKVLIGFAGHMIDVFHPDSGAVQAMTLCVATMAASNCTDAKAVATKGPGDWIAARVRLFAFPGGVAKAVVPDNLKLAVLKAYWYDPGLNRTCAGMAGHCGTAILPARPCTPCDKAKVKGAVQVAQRRSLARPRNRRFFPVA